MPSPNTAFSELSSLTFRKVWKKQCIDNISNRNALYKWMYEKGNIKNTFDGGLTIDIPLDFAMNGTYQRYSDWDLLNISQQEVITSASFPWRQIAINVVASGRELKINSGQSKIGDLVAARMKNAMRSFSNNFSFDMYSSGTLANQINGAQALVSDAGTGTVGGIDSSANAFWQNKVFSAAANSVTPSATTIENNMMLPMWLLLDRGSSDQPDLIVADNNYYTFFEASQTALKRYADASNMSAGITGLKYKNATVVYDGNSGCPVNHMYMFNTQYMVLASHRDADLTEAAEKTPINQDGVVYPVYWMGNLCISNRAQQGVIIA
jgi:hypothetical protein